MNAKVLNDLNDLDLNDLDLNDPAFYFMICNTPASIEHLEFFLNQLPVKHLQTFFHQSPGETLFSASKFCTFAAAIERTASSAESRSSMKTKAGLK